MTYAHSSLLAFSFSFPLMMASWRSVRPIRSQLCLHNLQKLALETMPVWEKTDRSRPRSVEHRPLPFCTPLSRRWMLPCATQRGLTTFRKLKYQVSYRFSLIKLQTGCAACCAGQSVCPFMASHAAKEPGRWDVEKPGNNCSLCLCVNRNQRV